MRIRFLAVLMLAIPLLGGCAEAPDTSPSVEQSHFGVTPSGDSVAVFALQGADGMQMEAMTYGGIILSLEVPDGEGALEDVALGFDSLAAYTRDAYRSANPYFGAVIGRYGNRIDEGRFSVNGDTYTLATNNGPNHLHGGREGFDQVVWNAEPFHRADSVGLTLTHTSPDGHGGYPGRLDVTVTYTLAPGNELVIDYEATTTETTPVNLTQHSYFNLGGGDSESILDHRLKIHAEAYTPVDSTLIPIGEYRPVQDTPFDFTSFTPIGERIGAENRQIGIAGGYDHNFVLAREDSDSLRMAAEVYDPESGRLMTVRTTEPGLQFYSGNFLDGSFTSKSGAPYRQHAGFALETQHFPDSPNQADFPSTLLRPNETYRSRTVYGFSTPDSLNTGP
ncbi:galactose-1-epimerase [Longimonas halophila]|uniref:Aldose 1-epimerase n=1 Tax=Longimonas halophila TaxID=1469170 RepID=A0A2H3NNV7_9BACT|nr:galactose-1-epimerase [Longimonas halophila]